MTSAHSRPSHWVIGRTIAGLFGVGILVAGFCGPFGRAQEKAAAPAETPKPGQSSPGAEVPPTQFINEQLRATWNKNGLKKASPASEFEFVRRVYLDLIGRIPRPDEIQVYLNKGRGGRAWLINQLLNDASYTTEYARNWANLWTVWLLTRTGNNLFHDQMHLWLTEKFEKNAPFKEIVSELITAKGKNNDNGAVNYIISHLGETNPGDKRKDEGHFEVVPITSRTTRLFLGMQTQCVQCHNHPFNPDWKQNSFWGVNVFFRQVKPTLGESDVIYNPAARAQNRLGPPVVKLDDDTSRNPEGVVYFEKRDGVLLPTGAKFLDNRKLEPGSSASRREQLAGFVTTHENFAKAYVNRIWGHLFGRGLNEQPAVDDFGEHNKVVHPELLEKLAKDFDYFGSDPKQLLAWICNSDAYQLTSAANSTNDKPEKDVFFSRMLLKNMSPEQLFESLVTATGADSSPETNKQRKEWMQKLAVNFGDDEGNEVAFNGTIIQALMLMNGREINQQILKNQNGTVQKAFKKTKGNKGRMIQELYMAALSRQPTAADIAAINKVANKYSGLDETFYADVFWALLNSNEFILNH